MGGSKPSVWTDEVLLLLRDFYRKHRDESRNWWEFAKAFKEHSGVYSSKQAIHYACYKLKQRGWLEWWE